MQISNTVGSILEAISILDFEDQLFVSEILQKRIIELRRKEIAFRIQEAEENYRLGKVRTGSVADLMMESSDESFTRILKKWRKKHPELNDRFQEKLELFKSEPFHPSLKTHSLSGNFAGSWAISINYEQRLMFKFLSDTKVLLIALGTHDEVY
jgi:mRNA-degrading endonuclease YafQ of YafQ-DinJ toxin-antitoxin module